MRLIAPVILTSLLLSGCGGSLIDFGTGQRGTPAGCTRGVLVVGTPRNSDLSTTDDCRVNDTGPLFESFSVTLTQGQAYLIRVVAPNNDLNVYLELLDATGQIVAFNDDDRATITSRNSQIVFVAPVSGTFNVRVRAFDASGVGAFTVAVRTCGGTRITGPVTLTGSIAPTDCRIANIATAGDSAQADFFVVPLVADASLTFRLSNLSADFDPVMMFDGPGFTADLADAVFGDSTLTVRAFTTGDYLLIVSGSDITDLGSYTLVATSP